MDPVRKELLVCWNASHGCDFVARSVMKNLVHFQKDCQFHPVKCFNCGEPIKRDDFVQHYIQQCRDLEPPTPSPANPVSLGENRSDGMRADSSENIQRLVQLKLKEIEDKVDGLQENVTNLVNSAAVQSSPSKAQMEDLKTQVSRLSDQVAAMRKKQDEMYAAVRNSSESLCNLVCDMSVDVGALKSANQNGASQVSDKLETVLAAQESLMGEIVALVGHVRFAQESEQPVSDVTSSGSEDVGEEAVDEHA